MFLKSLDIYGFKSFADKTHIDFAEGITALLGPNGCGKSNVVDAIKWVLAENRSKNLRAEKMEDVIFNGTEKRAALNTAEVTLTLSNENGLLPLDDSEIAITRRLYRSGDQEYFINQRAAGPTEIRRLFMDTGVGKAAYSVMEQGKIDQVLSSKPEDRRYLFEEAAGISRSKAECAEAERELEKTRINMQQIEISLNEIKRQYDSLKVQSEKTIKYRHFKDEIYQNELDLTLLRLKNFVQEKARHEEELKNVQQKRDKVRQEIEDINNTISENMDKVKELQNQLYAKQGQLIGIGQEKNGKLELIKQANARAGEIKEKVLSDDEEEAVSEENIEEKPTKPVEQTATRVGEDKAEKLAKSSLLSRILANKKKQAEETENKPNNEEEVTEEQPVEDKTENVSTRKTSFSLKDLKNQPKQEVEEAEYEEEVEEEPEEVEQKETHLVPYIEPIKLRDATRKAQEENDAKREEAINELMRESENLSDEEVVERMGRTLEDDYKGDFKEVPAIDFIRFEEDLK